MDETGYRVLLVEDNINDAKLLIKYFKQYSKKFDFDYAPNADRCYRFLIKHSYDLIILDYNLPDSTGLEIVRELKAMDFFAPIIMVTGEEELQKVRDTVSAGADDYIIKSVESYRKLPVLAEQQIDEYHLKLVKDKEFINKRKELYENRNIHELLKTVLQRNLRYISPRTHLSNNYNVESMLSRRITQDRLEKMLNILVHYRVMYRSNIGMKIICPDCGSHDVAPVWRCPNCGSEVFEKTRRNRYTCKGLCQQRFKQLKTNYKCNICRIRFTEEESFFEPQSIYSINEDLKEEVFDQVSKIEEIKQMLTQGKVPKVSKEDAEAEPPLNTQPQPQHP